MRFWNRASSFFVDHVFPHIAKSKSSESSRCIVADHRGNMLVRKKREPSSCFFFIVILLHRQSAVSAKSGVISMGRSGAGVWRGALLPIEVRFRSKVWAVCFVCDVLVVYKVLVGLFGLGATLKISLFNILVKSRGRLVRLEAVSLKFYNW